MQAFMFCGKRQSAKTKKQGNERSQRTRERERRREREREKEGERQREKEGERELSAHFPRPQINTVWLQMDVALAASQSSP